MNSSSPKKRFHLTQIDRAILKILAGMLVVTVILSVMGKLGLSLISGELYVMLPFTILVAAFGWGLFALLRRIQRKWLRIALTALSGIVLFLVVAVFMSYGGYIVSLTVPQKYNVVRSPSGQRSAVILRMIDSDEARITTRHDARVAADPDSPVDIVAADWGFTYTAYPVALKFFYRADADLTGEIHMGYGAESTLMVEWLDNETAAHFFVENAGPADGGEMTLRFE